MKGAEKRKEEIKKQFLCKLHELKLKHSLNQEKNKSNDAKNIGFLTTEHAQ